MSGIHLLVFWGPEILT